MSKRPTNPRAPTIDNYQTVERYEAVLLGAPFKVVLHNAVKQLVDTDTQKILRTQIPNLSGLRREVALARCLHPRKLSGQELKFIRKAIDLKAVEVAGLLDVTPEHLSRCEKGDRALSGAAEKLLRVIVLKRAHIFADLIDDILEGLEELDLEAEKLKKIQATLAKYRDCMASIESQVLKMDIESVFDPHDPLEFSFSIREIEKISANPPKEDDAKWELAKAA